ncbi:MAG: hypothetical protein OSA48_00310 [Akkermansiaceae bacterium]|jgi:hypothetical protein|nr:hypothetical protein [Akkermansiaceae bacterium]
MKNLRLVVMLWIAGLAVGLAEEVRLDPKLVDRDFKVTVDVASKKGTGSFVVVGSLSDGAIRVPIVLGEGVDYVVEVLAPTYKRNSATVLKPAVEVRVLNPEKLVTKGEEGTEPLALLTCQRSVDWESPGVLTILESENLTISLTLEPVAVPDVESDAAGEDE